MKLKNKILLCLSLCLSITLSAQKPTVRATIEPSDILIGEQAVINLEVISPKGRNIIFPFYPDTLVTGIEVLTALPSDTVMTEVMRINKKYIVTSFDSTLYHIPHLYIIDGNDTILSNDLGRKVSAPQLSDSTLAYLEALKNNETDSIDFNRLQLSDIKDIQDVPFSIRDFIEQNILKPLLIALGVIALALILYFILRKRKKGYYFTPKVVPPPHIVALHDLDELKAKKLCQKGMEKEFYTGLSDILRHYIDGRFHKNAPEMIMADIIEAVHSAKETGTTAENIKQKCILTDLVNDSKSTP